jgi:hypothetical protein
MRRHDVANLAPQAGQPTRVSVLIVVRVTVGLVMVVMVVVVRCSHGLLQTFARLRVLRKL